MRINPPPYALPSKAAVKTGMIEVVALKMIFPFGEPAVLVGEGTMPYPGNSRVLRAPDVAETVKETKLGKIRLLLGEAAVLDTSGLLVTAVCNGITDVEFMSKVAGRPPVPCASATEDVEIDGRNNEGWAEGMMIKESTEETVSPDEVGDTAGLLGGATHLVQSVDVEVRVTVEMVVVISSNDVLPEVTRLVTGQVVKVV